MELQPDDGPRSSLSIEPRFRRCSGISLEFVRRFAEGIGKLAGNMLGDCQKKTIGLVARILEVARLAGREPLFAKISIGFGLHPKKIGSGHWCASRRRTR
ncbi:hypothetical protein BHE74_00020546 [Ensete ventricosum]|nr:hypothetical protein BHE74_00020546 [Ensete ventricosum]